MMRALLSLALLCKTIAKPWSWNEVGQILDNAKNHFNCELQSPSIRISAHATSSCLHEIDGAVKRPNFTAEIVFVC